MHPKHRAQLRIPGDVSSMNDCMSGVVISCCGG